LTSLVETRTLTNKNLTDYMSKQDKIKGFLWGFIKVFLVFSILGAGIGFIWVSTFNIPDFDSFTNRQVQQSTKIYDRTGEIVLYDLNRDVRRTRVGLSDISENLIEATIAIEDSNFYNHYGIEPTAILRAVITNLRSMEFQQGGSTITQQVVKNTLLTPEKTIPRKLKEWILAIRIDSQIDKDKILEIYLNETPYGGRVYGAEEAADRYFGKSAKDLSIVESAYLAALPQAPTYYWNNQDQLKNRKDKVLKEMRDNGFITEDEYKKAASEEVSFLNQSGLSIRAPHFVFFIREYLEEQYGAAGIERQGLKVITTLNYDLQQQAEGILSEYGSQNAERFNATNAALVAVNPKNGQIITMVGSRDYENEEIQGNFNAATAARQPGSSFKPFVYATAFNRGYTDSTIVFDLPTQFSVRCSATQFDSEDGCFSPGNYDESFRGPITLRNALAQSVNVPAVKTFYLAGMNQSLDTARNMGISTLDKETDQYGLSLVLGSGEVTLLDLTSAYGVFANEGVRHPHTGIMRIENIEGDVLEEFQKDQEQVLSGNTARIVNDILSDNVARTPSFGPNSPLHFPNLDVAAKTGTTNNYLDLWTVGYTPTVAVGVWSGNNDNTPVNGQVAGFVVAPMWQEFMQIAIEEMGDESFQSPENENRSQLKPVLTGQWQGGYYTESNASNSQLAGGVHNILHWVEKSNPRGPIPSNPTQDGQYANWEYSVQRWVEGDGFEETEADIADTDTVSGDGSINTDNSILDITTELRSSYTENQRVRIEADSNGRIDRMELYVNNEIIDTDESQPFSVYFLPGRVDGIRMNEDNTLRIVGINEDNEQEEITHTFSVR